MELLPRIEIYSALPYSGGEDSEIDDWFHVARNQVGEHIEAVWDIEALFRPDISEEAKPQMLNSCESHFEEIRLHYALNYTSWKYHEELMIWCLRSLKPNGKLQIVSPDLDWILGYWLSDALNANNYEMSSELEEAKRELGILRVENDQLRQQLNLTKPTRKLSWFRRMLKDACIPEEALPELNRDEIIKEVKDKVVKDIPHDFDFDLWLMQQLYSSGAGEPQDTFKAVFNKRYLSTLLRRTGFVVTLLQNNLDNKKQIEAKAFKHPARIFAQDVTIC